jgi:glycosyltransferase involved in cell wall biosynthesis
MRILVVSFPFVPAHIVGAHRWQAMRDHLRERGHEVTVVTTSAFGTRADDAAQDVVRTADLMASPVLRRVLRRPPLPAHGTATVADTPAPGLLTKVVVPDGYLLSWTPYALAAVRRLLGERSYDAVVTTSPYESVHAIGLAVRRRFAWLADFRDGWRFEPHRPPFPTAAQERLDAALERTVVRRADAVVAATEPIAVDFRERLGVDAAYVPNGWDPRLDVTLPDLGRPGSEEGWVTIAHTGGLSGSRGRDPRPFLRALAAFNARADGGPRLRLVLAGRKSTADEQLLAEADLGDAVHHLGLLDRAGAVALQRSADALLLLTGDDRSEATGKLFEYLRAGRPILALAQANEAARIIGSTATGVCVRRDDAEAIAGALCGVADGSLARAHAPTGLERFTYPGPALAVEAILERVVARRGGDPS